MKATKRIQGCQRQAIPILAALILAGGEMGVLAQPANDLPCNAIELAVSDSCSFSIFSNMDAGDSGIPEPGCGSYEGGDVWFYVVTPADSTVVIQTRTEATAQFPDNDGWMYRAGMAIYHGRCDSLNKVDCYENNSLWHPRMAGAILPAETPGDTLWIRIWENSNNDNGKFNICVSGDTILAAGCPGLYRVSGGGGYCSGDTGVAVQLSASESGIRYTLLLNDTIRLDTLEGNGAGLVWPNVSAEGVYRVIAENPIDSCMVLMNDSAAVQIWNPPELSADAISITCFGDNDGSVVLGVEAEAPYTIQWTGPGGYQSDQQSLTNLAPGHYSVVVNDTNQCSSELTQVAINEPDLLVATADQVSHLTSYEAMDGAVDLSVTGGTQPYQVTWTGTDGFVSDDTDPTGMSVGYYHVMVTDSHLCQDSILNLMVSLSEDADGVFIPEGFSPNGDGLNDFLVILGIESFPDNELVILNRQGVELLHRVNYENNWDGKPEKGGVLGGVLPEGTYYYIFTYGASGIKKGYVYINRE